MKFTSACGISFLMLFLLVIGSFFNAGYLNKTTSFIINELYALPTDTNLLIEEVTELRNFWEGRKAILKFTQCHLTSFRGSNHCGSKPKHRGLQKNDGTLETRRREYLSA